MVKIIIVVRERLVSDNNEMEEVVWPAWSTLDSALPSVMWHMMFALPSIRNTFVSGQPRPRLALLYNKTLEHVDCSTYFCMACPAFSTLGLALHNMSTTTLLISVSSFCNTIIHARPSVMNTLLTFILFFIIRQDSPPKSMFFYYSLLLLLNVEEVK